jgi:phage terminase small subunit
MERRTLAELDVGMLTMLCVEWDQYSRAVAELEGASPSERSRVRGRMATAFKNYMAAADRFGLSPVAKRRVAVTRERSVGDKGRFFADATPMKIAE